MSRGMLMDTNILIDYLRNLPQATRFLENVSGALSISALSVAELHAGARDAKERLEIQEFLNPISILPADVETCRLGGDLCAKFRASHGVDIVDGIIGATAQIHQLALVTLNKKHFPMLSDIFVPYKRVH